MSAPRSVRPEPYAPPADDLLGFTAGVLRLAWKQPPEPYMFAGRPGRAFVASIVECRTRTGSALGDHVRASLTGLIVRSPEGALVRIAGVEMFCTTFQHVGATVGLLLVPIEEQ